MPIDESPNRRNVSANKRSMYYVSAAAAGTIMTTALILPTRFSRVCFEIKLEILSHMQITIKFGSSDFSINNIVIESVEDKTTVADILIQLREQMSPWHIAIMERGIEGLGGKDGVDSVVGGLESLPVKSHLFLAAEINGELEKLEADKRIGEYNLGEKPILQLMCSAIDPNAIK